MKIFKNLVVLNLNERIGGFTIN